MTESAVPPRLSRGAKALGFFLLALMLALAAGAIMVLTRPPVVDETQGGAHIFIAVEENRFYSSDCVRIGWDVEGIREIYFNGQPTVGIHSERTCASLPTLHIVFQDGSEGEYRLPVPVLSRNPWLWLLVGLSALLLVVTGYVLAVPWLARWYQPLRAPVSRLFRLTVRGVAGVLVLALLLELGVRAYFSSVGSRREQVMYLYTAAEINGLASSVLPLPYVSYVPWPGADGNNQMGYRGEEITIPKPDGVFRIVSLGGSTTFSSSTAAEDSYPTQLQAILREDYGYSNVEVINAGVIGFTSWDNLANYIYRAIELEPDLLLIYAGFNDVAPRSVDPDCYRGLNAVRGLNPTRALYQEVTLGPGSFSALYRLLAIHFGWMEDPSTLSRRFEGNPGNCPHPIQDNARIEINPPVYFERNMRSIILVALGNDTDVMLSTWTYSPRATAESIPLEWRPAIAEHNDIIRRLAAEYNLPFFDLAETDFAESPAHWTSTDPIHMSPTGTHAQAALYAAYLVEQAILPSPG